ncbi:hypothetical protein CEXT_237591 [Caerostris extrusa]|uniref:Uncharacterized protein n=1 Tax=Caerostris extrusa TaxID=172846 RepID=A0AAV4Y2T9_CAEEX|nr:hypothetical protein CEXT_237591 [Caerostris extrusa]
MLLINFSAVKRLTKKKKRLLKSSTTLNDRKKQVRKRKELPPSRRGKGKTFKKSPYNRGVQHYFFKNKIKYRQPRAFVYYGASRSPLKRERSLAGSDVTREKPVSFSHPPPPPFRTGVVWGRERHLCLRANSCAAQTVDVGGAKRAVLYLCVARYMLPLRIR